MPPVCPPLSLIYFCFSSVCFSPSSFFSPSLFCSSFICENVNTTVWQTTAECVRTFDPCSVVKQLLKQSEKKYWDKLIKHLRENRSPGHWCRCCQILQLLNAATFWASWGIALSLAPQRSLPWSRMLSSLVASCSLFSAEMTELQINTSPNIRKKCFHLERCGFHLNAQLILKHTLRMSLPLKRSVTRRWHLWPHASISGNYPTPWRQWIPTPLIWQAVYDLSVHL